MHGGMHQLLDVCHVCVCGGVLPTTACHHMMTWNGANGAIVISPVALRLSAIYSLVVVTREV